MLWCSVGLRQLSSVVSFWTSVIIVGRGLGDTWFPGLGCGLSVTDFRGGRENLARKGLGIVIALLRHWSM